MFGAMMDGIKEESVGFLFNLEVATEEPPAEAGAAPGVAAAPAGAPAGAPSGPPPIGVTGEPVPSEAPAAFGAGVEGQQPPAAAAPPQDERARVAGVLGQALGQPNRPAGLQYSAPTVDGDGGVTRSTGGAPAGGGTAGGGGRGPRGRPQRSLPVRVGPQVQALPRGTREPLAPGR